MTENTFSCIRALIGDAMFDFDVNHLTIASAVDNSSLTGMGQNKEKEAKRYRIQAHKNIQGFESRQSLVLKRPISPNLL